MTSMMQCEPGLITSKIGLDPSPFHAASAELQPAALRVECAGGRGGRSAGILEGETQAWTGLGFGFGLVIELVILGCYKDCAFSWVLGFAFAYA